MAMNGSHKSPPVSELGDRPTAADGGPKPEEFTNAPGGCGGGGDLDDSVEEQDVSYGFEDVDGGDAGDGGIYDFEGIDSVVYPDFPALQPGNAADQLTLSFRGQVYVFDNVTTEKVQKVFLLLGGCEFPVGQQGAELPYQNQRDLEYHGRCSNPRRAASLMRFRQKRKERCFEKKIRYNVRQEVAIRMKRKNGQFVGSKGSEESNNCTGDGDADQRANLKETSCAHCGTSSKNTPMMRKGPAGPRTLCNACGLFWASRGTMKNLSKRRKYHSPSQDEQDDDEDDGHDMSISIA